LHYFGEYFDKKNCNGMCDNCRSEKKYFDAQDSLHRELSFIQKEGDKFDDEHIINVFMGQSNQSISSYKHDVHPYFGTGAEQGENYWKSLLRQAVLHNFLEKDIDNYGLLVLTSKGEEFLKAPY